ncbi:cytochrome c oxidase assembly protein [Methylopila sp. Yamaguchi]|uniref:cytochrome c oxidase assembly protein n=1 Tax=Methylopila sp. Yamaguchi TaxID=1437817 RepID=UPI000CAFDA95|nr:cytochrome c oxidase assembly protein [Methylopila sp. Yamaguchi]GBD47781.1 cytochrome c oxidase assembly protein [Methylopila sp. Yamaguchi]
MTEPAPNTTTDLARRHRNVAAACGLFVAVMVGAAFAAVPLYDMFCRATGFDGTTQVAKVAPEAALDRTMIVRFDGNVAQGLDWDFRPEVTTTTVKVGETKLVNFKVRNRSDRELSGTATYNVTPETTGAYFAKLQCFCFTEQTLKPGEEIDMPVAFFVDPTIADERELDRVKQITLSYTFFPAKGPKPLAAVKDDRPKL